MTVLVAAGGWAEAEWVARLAAALPGRRVVTVADSAPLGDVRYVACWKHPRGLLRGLPNLAAIFSLGAGIDHILSDPDVPNVPIVRVVDPDLTARMSEYVVMHCLMHLRQQRRYDAQQGARLWDDDALQPAAHEVTIGLLGLGELGRDAATKLAVMGFRVLGWSRRPKTIAGIATFSGAEGLDAMLAETDILVSLLPLTPDTKGILDGRLLRRLRRTGRLGGPFLVNAGRGGLQVEADILGCLDDGTLKGASLDVFETEPLPAASPLWSHPAVYITPHNAAMSAPDAVAAHIARQIAAIEAGRVPLGLVDRAVGY